MMANFWLASVSSSALVLATREVFQAGSEMIVFISVRHLLKAVFFLTCIFLYSRRVSPWSSSFCRSVSWSLRCRVSRFLRSSNSSRDVEYRSLGTTFLTNFGGPKRFSVGLEVIESSVSRMLS